MVVLEVVQKIARVYKLQDCDDDLSKAKAHHTTTILVKESWNICLDPVFDPWLELSYS